MTDPVLPPGGTGTVFTGSPQRGRENSWALARTTCTSVKAQALPRVVI